MLRPIPVETIEIPALGQTIDIFMEGGPSYDDGIDFDLLAIRRQGLTTYLQVKPALYALTHHGVIVATGPDIMLLFALIQPPDMSVYEAARGGWRIERKAAS